MTWTRDDLVGKVAVVTGGGSGLGAAMAQVLADGAQKKSNSRGHYGFGDALADRDPIDALLEGRTSSFHPLLPCSLSAIRYSGREFRQCSFAN